LKRNMEFTINCTRVPIPKGTTLYGTPLDIGPAPAYTTGSESIHNTLSSVTSDGVTLIPSGGVSPDRRDSVPKQLKQKHHIVGCKNQTIVSSFNARTLRPTSNLNELAECSEQFNIDILAIQEHRFHHPETDLKYHQAGQYQLITSSAWKSSANAAIGGVGFLLSSKASSNLLNVEPTSQRILLVEFEGNPKTSIICVYSPHNSSPEENMEDFYTKLRTTVQQVPLHNFLVIAGDLNAKLGQGDVNFSYNPETNRNGEYLLDFMEEFNLFSSNNRFMKSKGQLWTFEYPNGDRAQLDYLIFRRKWQNSVRDSRAYSSFSSVGSDHRIISAKVKLSLRVSKKAVAHPMKRIDWKTVSSNHQTSKDFAIRVYNRFTSLSTSEITNDNIEEVYTNLIKSTEEVALATLPKKISRTQHKPSSSERVVEARAKLSAISSAYNKSPTQARKIQLISAKKALDDAYLDAETDYISGKISELSSHHISNKHHLAWKTVKNIAGKNNTSSIQIKGGTGKKRLDNWLNHFKNLLGKDAKISKDFTFPHVKVAESLDIGTKSFSLKELKVVVKQLKSSKAFGPDNIPPLIWKDEHFHTLLLNLCNHTFETLRPPNIWHKSQIIPMPKKETFHYLLTTEEFHYHQLQPRFTISLF
jgi:exonuclease III